MRLLLLQVAVLYASDYGFSDRLSQTIARGITKANVAVEMLDLPLCRPPGTCSILPVMRQQLESIMNDAMPVTAPLKDPHDWLHIPLGPVIEDLL